MINEHVLTLTPFAQNTRIVWTDVSKECVIVDPGGESGVIAKVIQDKGLAPVAIWLTHSHLDHCGGVAPLLERFPVPLYGHPGESAYRSRVDEVATMYGIPKGVFVQCPDPTYPISGGESLTIGDATCKVLFTPGHSPGHLCFYFAEEKVVIGGDLVFEGSVGRTDLPGGDHATLLASIEREILSLPDDVRIWPGHGSETTVGRERRTNPFFATLPLPGK